MTNDKKIGENRMVSAHFSRIKTYSLNPLLAVLDDFRMPGELGKLLASIPDTAMTPAGFFDPKGPSGGQNVNDQTRKALHKGFRPGNNALIDGMREDVSSLFGIDPEFGEPASMIRYGVGGEYKLHFDTWPFDQVKDEPKELALGPRFFTGIIYLNDDFEGGATSFPHLKVEIAPKAGRLVLWSNTRPGDLSPHPQSAHAGMPVTSGEKNILTFWLRTAQGADLMKKRVMDETVRQMKLQSMKTVG